MEIILLMIGSYIVGMGSGIQIGINIKKKKS
jgi:hypothetical protein